MSMSSSEENVAPQKLALVAMDWPNVWHSLRGKAELNYAYLRLALLMDAANRLDEVPERICYEAQAFVQEQHPLDSRPEAHRSQEYVQQLEQAKWTVLRKVREPDPLVEQKLALKLSQLIDTPEHRLYLALIGLQAYEDWDDLRSLAETLLAGFDEFMTPGQRRTLRKRPRLLADHGHENWDILHATCSEIIHSLLVRKRATQRRQFDAIITAMLKAELLAIDVRLPNLDAIPDDKLPEAVYELNGRIRQALRRDHHLRDIDLLLTNWLHAHFVGRNPADYQAIAYLVGDDYLNHLTAAERLARYGVQAVLVVSHAQYDMAHADTKAALRQHELIWLDDFTTMFAMEQLVS